MIEIKNLNFSYTENSSTHNIENLNLSISKGQVIVLCGESGCGKTTITRLINGLIPNYYNGTLTGSVTVDGKDITKTPLYEISENTGSVFQNPRSQFFNVDTNSELSFACENLGYLEDDIRLQVKNIIEEFEIQSLLGQSLFHLSGGEKQKIACASISTASPDIIILDEPSSNLDVAYIDIFKNIIAKWKAQGKTIIISEHKLYYLKDIADRFIHLSKGKIISDYTSKEFQKLSNKYLNQLGLRTLNLEALEYPIRSTVNSKKIELKDFHFAYKRQPPTLTIPNCSIPKHEIIAIIGSNGSGKTTFGRCLCGLEKVGKLIDNGEEFHHKDRLKNCYLVMQDVNHQLFTESVLDEILISTKHSNVEKSEEILGQLDLLVYKKSHPMSLSGGEKQRVAIATAIASDREYIVFDEPTSGLDFRHMKEVSVCLSNLQNLRKTIFVITHDIELILNCCTYILHIDDGKIINQYPLDVNGMNTVKLLFAQ